MFTRVFIMDGYPALTKFLHKISLDLSVDTTIFNRTSQNILFIHKFIIEKSLVFGLTTK